MAFPARGFKCLTQGCNDSHAQPKIHKIDGKLGKLKQILLTAGYHNTTSPQYANARTNSYSKDRSVTFDIPNAAKSIQSEKASSSTHIEVNEAAQTIALAAEKLTTLVESVAQLIPQIVGQRPQAEEPHPVGQHKQDGSPDGTEVKRKKGKPGKDKKKKKKRSKHQPDDSQESILSAATSKMLAKDSGNLPSDQHRGVDNFIDSMHQEGQYMTDTEDSHAFTPAMTKTQKQLYSQTLASRESKQEDVDLRNFQAKHTDAPNPSQTPVPSHTAPIPSPTFTAEQIKSRSQAVLNQRKQQLEQLKISKANEEQAKEQRRQERRQNQIAQITNLCPGIQQKSIDAIINTAMNPPEQPDGEALSDLARTIDLSKMAKVQLSITANSEAIFKIVHDPAKMAALIPRLSKFTGSGIRLSPSSALAQRINLMLLNAARANEVIVSDWQGPDKLVFCGMCMQHRDEANYKQFKFGQSTKYKVGIHAKNEEYLHLGPGQGHVYFVHQNCPALLNENWTVYTYVTDGAQVAIAPTEPATIQTTNSNQAQDSEKIDDTISQSTPAPATQTPIQTPTAAETAKLRRTRSKSNKEGTAAEDNN